MPVPNSYRGFRVTKGDGDPELAILLPSDFRVLHIARAEDENTNWALTNPTHPTVYIHSATTPATDYGSLSHDATDFIVDALGANLRRRVPAASYVIVPDGIEGVRLGNAAAFATTPPTNALILLAGTAPAGAITNSSGLFASTTVLQKIIAAGTVSNVET